jgi:short-subunit dehydrogenase
MKKNVLITGTSTGVGLESSILFAQNGYKVYATMRNIKKGLALQEKIKTENLDIEILPLDVTDAQTIADAVDTIIKKDGKIDLLINNAGAGFAKTTEQTSEEEMNWVTDVNYTGVVRCIKAVLPIMRKQRSGHIINITSVGGLVGQPFNEFYCAAKFAVEGYTESLASYVSDAFNIQFSLVEPGGISTEFIHSAISKTSVDGQLSKGEYLPLFERYMTGTAQRAEESKVPVYQTGLEVAQVILEVANKDTPPFRVRTSDWAENLCQLKTASDPDGTKLIAEVKAYFL